MNRVDNIAKDRLAHYVCLRKVVLDLFKKSLEWNEDKEIENEDTIHNIVYPRYTTSNDISYDHQNLWLIDERLNFSELVISENIIEG
ncbi:MAG: hypothetical protein E2590_04845 [Chryseobacterium sp.]|nr:hypothetical protein [Chryseobacterium sp.]